MALHTPTKLDALMLAFQAQLMAETTFPAERVLIVPEEDVEFHPEGDQYLTLWPDSESSDRPSVVGSGRINCQVTERFGVTARTRLTLDESTSGLIWLTDATLGHVALRHKIWSALIDFQAVDGSSNILNFPILPAVGSRPARGKTVPGNPPDRSWGKSTLLFDVTYVLDLSFATFQ